MAAVPQVKVGEVVMDGALLTGKVSEGEPGVALTVNATFRLIVNAPLTPVMSGLKLPIAALVV